MEIVIIGGGVTGLAAGIFGRRQGHTCHILEQNPIPGGALTGWDRRGYHIDGCIHWLTGTRPQTPLYRLWQTVGAFDRVRRLPWLYQSRYAGQAVHFWRSAARTRQEMLTLSPRDEDEIRRFFRAVNAAKRISGLPREGSVADFAALAAYFTMDLFTLSRRFRHPLLQRAMTDYIGGEYSALGLIFAYAAFSGGNGDLPAGGSRQMAQSMTREYLRLGGHLETNTRVSRIVTRNGRAVGVKTADGRFFPADGVLCCMDPKKVFRELLPDFSMPIGLQKRFSEEIYQPFSAIHAAYGVSREALPFRGTVCVTCAPYTLGGRKSDRLCVREFSHEPTFAPPGKTVIQCLFFIPREEARRWIRLRQMGEPYTMEKRQFTDWLTAQLITCFPTVKDSLTLLDCWTPATYHHCLSAFEGSFMGFAIPGGRWPVAVSGKIPGLTNVRLAGGWLQPPGGLPIALRMGRKAIPALERACRLAEQ